ncbi:MAG: efflux RND transporter permease subunit [Hyphomonadaceae bacterium]|nr:efflux RND transporter permease subunit [Hyphomonadaceae bacterium]
MAWNISAAAIRNPIPPILLILALLIAGTVSFFRLPINQIPNVDFPVLTVTVTQAGAAPAEMETQIAQRVEAALSGVQGVRRVTTEVSPGASTSRVELQLNQDINQAVDDARDAVTRIRANLPADINEPIIQRLDFAAQPIAYYALEAPTMTEEERSWFIDNDLTRELLAVPGVAQVQRAGGVDREIRVELDPARLTDYGLSADAVSRQIRSQNADLPGGQAVVSGQAQTIRTLGSAETLEQLRKMQIPRPMGGWVRLEDLGTVTDSSTELSSIARYNGQPVVSFVIQRSKSASEVDVFHAVERRLREITAERSDINVRLVFTSVDFIEGMYESSISALIEGALLACLVVFLTLRNWRATLIAAAAIPLAIIPTFWVIELLGFTINMMTMIALALVAGVLVDDAIVEIENIVRHIRMGRRPYDAAMEAADEIGLAVVATSAAIIVVFLPIAMMNTDTSVWFKEFGLTVAIATFFSLVVARLITPMMAAHFLKDNGHEEKDGDFIEIYRGMLSFAMRKPWATFGMGIGVFIFSVSLSFFVPVTFMPRVDMGMVQQRVEVPPGTPLVEADRAIRDMAARIATIPEVKSTYTSLSGVDGAGSSGDIFVILKDRGERERSAFALQQAMRPMLMAYPNYRVTAVNNTGPGPPGADISIQLVGSDPALVTETAARIASAASQLPQLADVRSSAALQRPELHVRPRPADQARLGVTSASISSAVRIATSGDIEQNLARYDLPDRQIPIRVLLRPDSRSNLEALRSLPVQSSMGPPVRLDAVADISFGFGEVTIERRDRERAVTIGANVVQGDIGSAQAAMFALPELANLPPGIRIALSGDTEMQADMFVSFGMALVSGVLLIYAVLVLLFRDFFHPLTIMTALPLSIGGAFGALLVTAQPLSLFVLIGLIMLMGIVSKNSILLVDFAIEQIHKGMDRNAALMEAGMKRARPILMTTFAMCAGMMPAALGWSVDGAMRQGMGAAVIGGLLLATMLSLVYVPAMFVLVDRLERWFRRTFLRQRADEQPSPAAAE